MRLGLAAVIAALALALVMTAQADVVDPAAIPPVEPVEPVEPVVPVEPVTPVVEQPTPNSSERVVITDPLVQCKTLLLDEVELDSDDARTRDARLDVAEKCFRAHAAKAAAAENKEEAARALAMADVVAAARASGASSTPASVPAPITAPKPAAQPVSLTGIVESGRAEALLHGAAAGAGGGMLLAATWFSITREPEADTLPYLIAAPALGALGGGAGAWALVEVLQPTTGDIAFASSAMWLGAAQGTLLQLAVFDGNLEVTSTPLRFLTVVGGGAVGLATGIALSPFVDVTQGDAAVANSAALWGSVMSAFALSFMSSSGTILNVSQVSLVLSLGSSVPYVAVVAAHPYLNIERWPSWLIEAGGASGFLVAGALVVVGSQTGLNGPLTVAVLGAGTLAGVVVGTGAAWAVSTQMPSGNVIAEPSVAFAPSLFPDESRAHNASSGRGVVPGFVIGGRF